MIVLFVYGGLMDGYNYDYGFLEDFTRIIWFWQLALVNFDFFSQYIM